MIISDETYKYLRWVNDLLPILGTLATTLLALYGAGEESIAIVGGTFTALVTALVSFLRICEKKYDEVNK